MTRTAMTTAPRTSTGDMTASLRIGTGRSRQWLGAAGAAVRQAALRRPLRFRLSIARHNWRRQCHSALNEGALCRPSRCLASQDAGAAADRGPLTLRAGTADPDPANLAIR